MMRTALYKNLLDQYTHQATRLQQRLNMLSFSRLALFVAFLFLAYQATQKSSAWLVMAAVIALLIFFVVVKWYDRLQQKTIYYKALAKCNADEITFLQTHLSPYASGKEYETLHHPYSYDMDLFGSGGLFAFVNRCSTYFGRAALAKALLAPQVSSMGERQTAIKELSEKLTFRQQLFAHGSLHESKEKDLQKLMAWAKDKSAFISKPLYYALLLFPIATIGSLLYYFTSENDKAFQLFSILFITNLIIAFSFAKKIASQLSVSSSVTKILLSYKEQLRLIEKENFQSALLQNYQQQLRVKGRTASFLLHQLANLFEQLETIINLVVSILLNGLALFHIHLLYRLGLWKKQHAAAIADWLQLIGEVEALNSFANISYNNPSFCFPEISSTPAFAAIALGHPLIKEQKRVDNDVCFNEQKFIILTGSNMSGKSTFLRTLGINLILAKAGSAVCAKQMQLYPFDLFVSMRITDSLQDSESFFYAELKRLQAIIQHLQQGHTTLVVLDEILRGTNSNDKRKGTIGLIQKMAKENTFGIIATHDVVVAEMIKDYPDYIATKTFESQIVADELLFDYQLKNGVCTQLSASYLMKKMGVIE